MPVQLLLVWASAASADSGSEPVLFWEPEREGVACPATAGPCEDFGNGRWPAGSMVFVPVRDGEIVRSEVAGETSAERGLAYGSTPEASVVVWLPPDSGEAKDVLVVPFASRARYAVFRSDQPFRMFRLRRRVDFHASQERLGELLRLQPESGRGDPSEVRPRPGRGSRTGFPLATLVRVEREIEALKDAFPTASAAVLRGYGERRALELSAELEPLRAPFFVPVGGGRRQLRAGEALPLEHGRIHSLKIRTRVGIASRVRIVDGGVSVRMERFSGTEGPSDSDPRFSRYRLLRLSGNRVRLEVDAGEVEVEARSFSPRRRLFDRVGTTLELDRGRVRARLGSPREGSRGASIDAVLRALAAVQGAERDRATLEAVGHGSLPPVFALRLALRYWKLQTRPSGTICQRTASGFVEAPEASASDDPALVAAQADAVTAAGLMSLLCWRQPDAVISTLARNARNIPADAMYGTVAREALRRYLGFRTVPGSGRGLQLELPPEGAVPGQGRMCPRSGPSGPRWRVLGAGRHLAHLSRGSRAGLQIRIASEGTVAEAFSPWQGNVRVNGQAFAVHGSPGLVTTLDTRPGDLSLEIPFGAPNLLVRLPYADAYPCEALRDVLEVEPISGGVSYSLSRLRLSSGHSSALGGLGMAYPVARAAIDWRAFPGSGGFRRFRIIAGRRVLAAEVGPEFRRDTVEIPLSARSQRISVRPMAETARDTVHLRLAALRVPASQRPLALDANDLPLPSVAASEAELLELVRSRSSVLRQDPRSIQARRDRAQALWQLGQVRASRVDFGAAELPPPTSRRSLGASSQPIRGNWLSRLTPLPVRDQTLLEEAGALAARGQLENALELLGFSEELPTLEQPGDGSAEQLFAGVLLARLGRPAEAAKLIARLGQAAAYGHAAELFYAAASEAREAGDDGHDHVLAALSLATLARQEGEPVEPLLRRVLGLVRWQVPAASASTGGTRIISRDPNQREVSLRARVHRSLLGAPDDALLLRRGEWLEAEWRLQERKAVVVERGCLSLDTLAPCTAELFIDGVPSDDQELDLPPGSRRVELRPPDSAIAWLRLSGEGVPAPVTRSLYYEVVPSSPVRFEVAGAALVRVVAASELAPGELERQLTVRVNGERVPLLESEAGQVEVPVASLAHPSQVQRVEISARDRMLIRPQVASADVSTLRPEPLVPVEHRVTNLPPLDPWTGPPMAGGAIESGPFSARLSLKGAIREIRDLDAFTDGTPYLELRPEFLYRDHDSRFRVLAAALLRSRSGPASYGTRLQFSLASDGYRPGLLLTSEFMFQDLDKFQLGFQGSAALLFPLVREPWIRLDTVVGATVFAVRQPASGQAGVDPDVFNRLARDHPVYGSLALVARSRPFLDFMVRGELTAQTNADLLSLDRFGGAVQLDWLPGRGLVPWFAVGYDGSYRLADEFRPQAIGRHILFGRGYLWSWLFGEGRLGFSAELQWIIDRQEFAGFLALDYLFSPRRGVHDLSRGETPYRERLEEGAVLSDELRGSVGVVRPYSLGE